MSSQNGRSYIKKLRGSENIPPAFPDALRSIKWRKNSGDRHLGVWPFQTLGTTFFNAWFRETDPTFVTFVIYYTGWRFAVLKELRRFPKMVSVILNPCVIRQLIWRKIGCNSSRFANRQYCVGYCYFQLPIEAAYNAIRHRMKFCVG